MEYSPTATVGETGYWGDKYGDSSTGNQFQIWNWNSGQYKGNLGGAKYYPVTNKDNGDIAIVKVNNEGDDYSIGTVKNGSGDFVNYGASQEENYYFNLPINAEGIKKHALQTANLEYKNLPAGNKPSKTPNQLLFSNAHNTQIIPAFDDSNIPPGVSESVAVATNQTGQSGNISGNSGGISGTYMAFPGGIIASGNDYIEIADLEYIPSEIASGGGSWTRNRGGGNDAAGRVNTRIILPIPGGINDSNGVSWGEGKMNPIETGAANLALGAVEGGGDGLTTAGEQMANTIQGNKGQISKALKAAIVGGVTGTNAQFLQRTEGMVMNPNMELLFGGPTLRTFTFNFKLSPRNNRESETIVKIIHHFKRSMAPKAEGPMLFLRSPQTWRLTYKHKGGDHKFLNKFKECAMTNCSVQYTDGGNYSTYEDGAMTTYGLGLTFQELEPIFQNDYQGSNEIGY